MEKTSIAQIHINEVQRFIPDIEVGGRTQAGSDEDLFLLPAGKIPHILFKLHTGEIHLSQNGLEQAFVDALRLRVVGQ